MADFFEETTSNYSGMEQNSMSIDKKDEGEEEEMEVEEESEERNQKTLKPFSQYTLSQRFLYHPNLKEIDYS